MRKIFIVVAKMYGLLQVYYGLANVTSIMTFFGMFGGDGWSSGVEVTSTGFSGNSLPLTLFGILATLALSFGTAWLLLCRAAWLADKLSIPEEQEICEPDKDSMLLVGVTLIGVYITVRSIPAFASGCLRPGYDGKLLLFSVLPQALRLALGLLLAIRPRLVLALLSRGEKTQGRRLIIGGLLAVALLLVAGRGITSCQSNRRCEYRPSRGLPSNTEIGPLDLEADPSHPWYSFGETTPDASTNGIMSFTNAPSGDVVEFLLEASETE